MSVVMVREADINKRKPLFESIHSEELYSVQKSKNIDFDVLSLVDRLDVNFPREDPLIGSIVGEDCIKCNRKVEKLPPIEELQKNSKLNIFNNVLKKQPKTDIPKVESSATSKDEENSSKKSSTTTTNKQKPKGGIANFFSKNQSNKNQQDKKPQQQEQTTKKIENEEETSVLEKPAENSTANKMDVDVINCEDNKDSDGKISQDKLCNSDKKSQEKLSNTRNSSKKSNKKRSRSNKKQNESSKKRRRIVEHDSDSDDDMFRSDEESESEIKRDSEEGEDEEIKEVKPLVKIDWNAPKNKKRKLVDKTYTDEEGYILTRKEWVYESGSDEEISQSIQNANSQVEKKIVELPKPASMKINGTSESDENIKRTAKIKGKKGTKKAATANQPTLMNFFKKQ